MDKTTANETWQHRFSKYNQELSALRKATDYFNQCGDCGQFVPKDRWIKKDNRSGYTHALCSNCISNYDGTEYY